MRWRRDLAEALLVFGPRDLWRVTPKGGVAKRIPAPHPGSTTLLAYGESNDILAFNIEMAADNLRDQNKAGSRQPSDLAPENARQLRFEEQVFEIGPNESIDESALAHVFVLGKGGAWEHREVKPTEAGDDYLDTYDGITNLDLFKSVQIPPQSGYDWQSIDPFPPDGTEQALEQLADNPTMQTAKKVVEKSSPEPPEPAWSVRSAESPPPPRKVPPPPPAVRKERDKYWLAIKTKPPAYVYGFEMDFVHAMPDVAFDNGDEVVRAAHMPVVPANDEIRVLSDDPFILLQTFAGRQARVFDATACGLVFSSDKSLSATFWPR